MSGPGAVQLFMFVHVQIHCWTSSTVMVTCSCSGGLPWSALKSCNHCASVLCVFLSCHIVFQYRSVSAFDGSDLIVVLHWSWEYTLDGSLENRAFIFFASPSLVYLLSLLASATSLCLAVSRASGGDSPLCFYSMLVLFFIFTPFCISTSWLTFVLLALILASSLIFQGICLMLFFSVQPSISRITAAAVYTS